MFSHTFKLCGNINYAFDTIKEAYHFILADWITLYNLHVCKLKLCWKLHDIVNRWEFTYVKRVKNNNKQIDWLVVIISRVVKWSKMNEIEHNQRSPSSYWINGFNCLHIVLKNTRLSQDHIWQWLSSVLKQTPCKYSLQTFVWGVNKC